MFGPTPYDAAPGPGAVPPSLLPCPSCGLTDQVRGVPAEYHAGRTTESVRTRRDDRTRTETRVVVSDLARALAPAPDRHPERIPVVLGVLALFGCGVAFFVANSQEEFDRHRVRFTDEPAWSESSSDVGFLHGLSITVLIAALALFLTAGLLRARTKRELAGRPQAEHLWSRAWYCARCGTAHFPPTAGQGDGALSLGEFRARVWTAGGYGHLLERYRH